MGQTFYRAVIDSPIQPLAIAFDAAGALRALSFEAKGDSVGATMAREYPGASLIEAPVPDAMVEAFGAYFAGDRSALERIPWSLDGATGEGGFQARVWVELTRIPAGQTISYGEMARRAGGAGP